MFRRRRPSPPPDPLAAVDPAAAPRRFARPIADAVEARRRFRELIDGLRPGPVHDRLNAAGLQLDAGILSMWDTVQRAGELERILATLDPDRVTDEYKRARRSDVAPDVLAAHEARFSSVQRLLNALDGTDERLALLDVRMGALVARAAEVALAAGAGADELDGELASLVEELGALRSGLDSLG